MCRAGCPLRDYSTRHTVMTTWQVSFKQIQKRVPTAADLLSLMSMFDRQGIPEHLLHNNTDILLFEDAIALLVCFSLIQEQTEKRSFEMHRLVQLSTRQWLELNGQLVRWRKKSVEIMAK